MGKSANATSIVSYTVARWKRREKKEGGEKSVGAYHSLGGRGRRSASAGNPPGCPVRWAEKGGKCTTPTLPDARGGKKEEKETHERLGIAPFVTLENEFFD